MKNTILRAALLSTILTLVLFLPTFSHSAPVETVTNTNDAGPGSFRQAIADVDPGGSILFDQSTFGQAINLTSGSLVIDKDISIFGLGRLDTIIDGSGIGSAIFDVQSTATVVGLTSLGMRNNPSVGISIKSGASVFIEDVSIVNTTAGVFVNPGGSLNAVDSQIFDCINSGVFVSGGNNMNPVGGSALLNDITFLSNFQTIVAGGGVGQGGNVTLIDSRISFGQGTGVQASGGPGDGTFGGTVSIIRSSISRKNIGVLANNGAFGTAESGYVRIINSTIFENTTVGVRAVGGDNNTVLGGTADISFSTIAESVNGDGIEVVPDTNGNPGLINVKNSIVAQNGGLNCVADAGDITAVGANFSTTAECNALDPDFTTVTEMALNMDETLGQGSTLAINPPSAAIDAATDCTDLEGGNVDIDQRSFPRPFGTNCDSGAYEYMPLAIISIAKETTPQPAQNISFETGGLPNGNLLEFGFELNDGEQMTTLSIPANGDSYSFWESPLQPFNLLDIVCTGNSNPPVPVIAGLGGVTITPAADEIILCTFINEVLPFTFLGVIPKAAGGINQFLFEGAQPNEEVAIIWGFSPGNVTINSGTCMGANLGIKNPKLLAITSADGNGDVNFPAFVPLGAVGVTVAIQGVALENCRVSNVAPITFTDDN